MPVTVKGTTRGSDLWLRNASLDVYQAAYGVPKEGRPTVNYTTARWELWKALPEAEREEWRAKGLEARQMVQGDVSKIKPPILKSR